MADITNSKILQLILFLFAVCLVSLPAQAADVNDSEITAAVEVSTYVFVSDQSIVVQTGGIAGVHWTYSIEGQFQLSVDPNAGIASFVHVDANATDDSPYRRTLDPNEVFNMTELAGTIVEDESIRFEGTTDDGSNVLITLTSKDDSVHLTGETTPPAGSADFFIFNMDAVAQRKYGGGGSGTPEDPYLIYTAEHLNAIGAEPNDWDKHFKLMSDIDLQGVSLNPIGYWTELDDEDDKPFVGVFDGNGKSISNISYTSPGHVNGSPVSTGLFLYVSGMYAEIRDLTLIDPNVQGTKIGPLVGRLDEGTIASCTVTGGYVSGFSNMGGLIGIAKDGAIKNCFSSSSVTGKNYVGGLVGQSKGHTTIIDCGATGAVHGTKDVGGLVGLCKDDTLIMNCGATGRIHGDYAVGGLVGRSERATVIAGSFASGDVSIGKTQIGGLVGDMSHSRIICCYATGNVSGGNGVAGGLVGDVSASYIADSYATGQVSGTSVMVGGFSGDDWASTYDCFWDIESSQISKSGLGTGLTTVQMQDPNTFISAGWDFVGESANGPSDIWIMPEGRGYPILSWQASPLPPLPTFSGGTGEPNDPFIISTSEELNSIGRNPRLMAAHFKLVNDVDLAGVKFFLIGSEGYPFRGLFDGDGYSIHNFSHQATGKYRQWIGLFRKVCGSKAEIRNLLLTGASVVNQVETSAADLSRPENVGSLVGLLYEGTILNCHVEDSEVLQPVIFAKNTGGLIGCNLYGIVEGCSSAATVSGDDHVGGLIGWNRSGVVFNCHSSAAVLQSGYGVGGLAGSNWALIVGCSASGNVSGDKYVGGLVGDNFNTIVASCSYADVVGFYSSVGGLVGRNLGPISNSYARGIVSGGDSVGGLVGDNTYIPIIAGSIVTSYSTGFVSGTNNVNGLTNKGSKTATTGEDCFWDIETSGQLSSAGGVGKITAEMQTVSTFLDAGWDFLDETENGTEDIWWILEGQDYPRLWWEAAEP